MSNIENFLTQTDFFKSLSASEAIEVLQSSRKIKFPKGLEIVKEGEEGETFYLITEGRVEVSMRDHSSGQDSVKIAMLSQGQVFGEMILIGKKNRQATVKAYSDIEILEWRQEDIDTLFEDKPVIGQKILRNLARIMSDRLMDMNLKLRNTPEFDLNELQSGIII